MSVIYELMRCVLKKFSFILLFFIIGYFILLYNYNTMIKTTKPYIYTNIKDIPTKKVALLLGTTKYLKNKKINYFYKYRIEAALKLYKHAKIQKILVSGDNGTQRYDETTDMRNSLLAAGVLKDDIILDYAGFRTLDSIVRAKAIFGLDDYIIISQRFHLERAIYLAQAKGQKVIGFTAKELQHTAAAKKMKYREILARFKAWLDIWVLKTKPKFLGEKIPIAY